MKRAPLVINVRGNSGSGKTHLTRQFMKEFGVDQPLFFDWIADKRKRPHAMVNKKQTIAVVGSYDNACGGCDTIKTQHQVVERVEALWRAGYKLIWLEGLIMSTIYGSVGEYSEQLEDRWVFAYLDTPIEECIKRVKARRVKAGKPPEFNEKNTRNRVNSIISSRARCVLEGRTVLDLNHKRAFEQVMNFIRKEKL